MRIFSSYRMILRGILWRMAVFSLAAVLPSASVLAAQHDLSNFSKHGLVIGVANGYIGNNWRTQMINDVRATAKPYEQAGIVKRLVIANANNNLSEQISQIHNMISEGVNAIIVDAVSPKALGGVIADAAARHILVVGADNGVVSPQALDVTLNEAAWARLSARWVFKNMHGHGNLLAVNGLAGQAVNTIRWDAVKTVLAKKYPKIKVLQQVYGKWDEAAAKQAVSSVLSTYDHIAGVWSQDGMAIGTIQAFQAANRKLPVVATDDNLAYLRLWMKLRRNGFSTIAVDNPPGIAATAFKVAVRKLEGWKLKHGVLGPNPLKASQHNTILVKPSLIVTDKNLASVLKANNGKPDSYYLDHVMTAAQVDRLFAHK